jgi:hypothetical protein
LDRRARRCRELAFPARKRRRLRRLRCECLERRELCAAAVRDELEDVLRPVEILEAMLSQVEELDAGRQLSLDELAGGPREQDLASVPRRADTGGAMNPEADVALAADGRLGRVDADADPDFLILGPAVIRQRALGCEGRREGVPRPPERDEEGVALGVDLVAAGLLEGVAKESLMVGEERSIVVAESPQQPRGTLDVAEEKGDRSGRELSHSATSGRACSKVLRVPASIVTNRCSSEGQS